MATFISIPSRCNYFVKSFISILGIAILFAEGISKYIVRCQEEVAL